MLYFGKLQHRIPKSRENYKFTSKLHQVYNTHQDSV